MDHEEQVLPELCIPGLQLRSPLQVIDSRALVVAVLVRIGQEAQTPTQQTMCQKRPSYHSICKGSLSKAPGVTDMVNK